MEWPLLSVIVPIFNSEKYLTDCIISIINQSYQNIELILVNDGSTDSSEDIVLSYLKKDSRLRYISKENGGVSSARNVGIENANGNYITFVDSDDMIEKEMYSKMMSIMKSQEQGVDIVCCGYYKVSMNGSRTAISGHLKNIELSGESSIEHLLVGDLFTGSPCTKIYSKSLLDDIRFREDIAINEDVFFNYCLMKISKRVVYINDPLYFYYEREGSATQTTPNLKKYKDSIFVSEAIYRDCMNTVNESLARTKYIYGLMNYYRLLLTSNATSNYQEKRYIANEIKKLLKMKNSIHKKYIISFRAMRLCPVLYLILYKYYDRIRKPNWDIVC